MNSLMYSNCSFVSDNLQPERVKNRHKKNVTEKSGSWANKKVLIFFSKGISSPFRINTDTPVSEMKFKNCISYSIYVQVGDSPPNYLPSSHPIPLVFRERLILAQHSKHIPSQRIGNKEKISEKTKLLPVLEK